MLTLDAALQIPAYVLYTMIEQDAVLLNTLTNKYYSLNEVGARFWNLLTEGKTLRQVHQTLLKEFEVESPQLEQDLLNLSDNCMKDGLIEITEAYAWIASQRCSVKYLLKQENEMQTSLIQIALKMVNVSNLNLLKA
jgi:hypothetical protein